MSSDINVIDRIRNIVIKNLKIDSAKIKDNEKFIDARFIEDLEADSLSMIELVMAFEEEFDIEIPDSEAAKIKTVSDAVKFIESTVSKK